MTVFEYRFFKEVIKLKCGVILGFPGGSAFTEFLGQLGDGFHLWVRKIPWSRKWQPTPLFLLGQTEEPGCATVHGVAQSQTQLK